MFKYNLILKYKRCSVIAILFMLLVLSRYVNLKYDLPGSAWGQVCTRHRQRLSCPPTLLWETYASPSKTSSDGYEQLLILLERHYMRNYCPTNLLFNLYYSRYESSITILIYDKSSQYLCKVSWSILQNSGLA